MAPLHHSINVIWHTLKSVPPSPPTLQLLIWINIYSNRERLKNPKKQQQGQLPLPIKRTEQIKLFSLERRWLGFEGINKVSQTWNRLEKHSKTLSVKHRLSLPVGNVAGGFCQHLQDSALQCSQILPPVQLQHTSHEPTCQDRRGEKEINMH